MIRICTALVELGYDVTLVGRKRKVSAPFSSHPFQQIRLTCWFQQGKFFYIEYNIRLFFWLLSQEVHIIYSVDLDTILAGYAASLLRQKVIVYDAHEFFTQTPEVIERKNIQRIWEQVAQWTIPNINYCITVGKGLANLFEEKYHQHFEVVRNMPFAQSLPETIKNTQSPILLYQGALNEGRGLEQMIEAMPQLPDAQLWLAGEGDLSDKLRNQVKQKGLDNQVIFLGYVKPEELKKVTLKVSIGLNLLENKGLSYYYSLANKAFDYVQAEVPSINMNFPEYQQLNQEYEVFTLIDDLEQSTLLDAIHRLLQDQDYYNHLKGQCQLARQEWNWEKEKNQLTTFFLQIESENFSD